MKRVWKSRGEQAGNFLDQVLLRRGVASAPEREIFFNPKYEQSFDPFLLKDMEKAVERVVRAVEKEEKITIYADYDADAVTAAAVLLRFFEQAGFKNADCYIPDRFSEGYGMNVESVETLRERGTNLIITVDCGINALEPVMKASQLGIDVVVTDHHRLTGPLPNACAVVNQHRPDDEYPFKDLTGVGVAFKLVQALAGRMKIKAGWEKWLLDLVAIGTVADCQSLLSENRVFVKWGLQVMKKTRWPGLAKLIEVAGVPRGALDTYKIGFVIAPRINAAGRIEHANLALELLLTNDESRAAELAAKLDDLNRLRQQQTEGVLSEAREQIAQDSGKKILLAAGQDWPKGIVGLVAGRLTEEFSRPVLILEKGVEEATGSARSVGEFNIIEAISRSKEILVRYGGHPQAAGFTLRTEHIELFRQNLLKYADEFLNEEDLSPVLYYDAEIKLPDITGDLVETLEKFEPFGLGNPRPRFRINNLAPRNAAKIGQDGRHLRMYAGDFSCVGFSLGFWADKMQTSGQVDIICEPQYNEWNGQKNIQLKIVDLNFSTSPASGTLPRPGEGWGEVEP